MIREILFRGIREDNGEWVYGYLLSGGIFGGSVSDVYIFSNQQFFKVKKETVGQYTGLKDKHSVLIYEGDVIKVGDNIMPVSFERGCWTTSYGISAYRLYGWDIELVEVIGSIHQNPELLKKD